MSIGGPTWPIKSDGEAEELARWVSKNSARLGDMKSSTIPIIERLAMRVWHQYLGSLNPDELKTRENREKSLSWKSIG